MVVSVITLAICYPAKILSIRYKKQLRNFPIPGELIVLVGMILFATFWDQAEVLDMVGEIPSGIQGK